MLTGEGGGVLASKGVGFLRENTISVINRVVSDKINAFHSTYNNKDDAEAY